MLIWFIVAVVLLVAGGAAWFRSGAKMPWDRGRR